MGSEEEEPKEGVPKEEAPKEEEPKKKDVRWGCPPDSRCAAGFPIIPVEDLENLVKGLPNWVVSKDAQGVTTLNRSFVARNWGA
eukprot:9479401-Pyramimonas_sp.AAC.1